MYKIIFTIVLIFQLNFSFSQVFIPLDIDTNEFIDEVNYSLFLKKKQVFRGVSEYKNLTIINNKINYDSISFSRIDYNSIGFPKGKLDSIVYLTKKIIYLDEIVVSSKKEDYLLIGETNRFIKKQSRPITEELIFGIIHKNEFNKILNLKKLVFFTEKIYHKTAYKINFYEVNETLPKKGNQFAEIGNLIYSTDTLYVDKKNKSKIELDINSEITLKPKNSLFISFQLLNYYDVNNNLINPNNEHKTKLKFQLSNKVNYYSKTIDLYTKVTSTNLININHMINYDFANEFFLKPHKSILVSPAVILYAKENEN